MKGGNMKDVAKLWQRYKKTGSQALREEIIKRYLYLVKFVAGRVAVNLPSNVEFGDLVSYGILGLLDAIEKYDPEQGNKFETYGVTRIRGAIMDELRKLDWAPRLLRRKARDLEKKIHELEEKYGRAATEEELAKGLDISIEELGELYQELNSTTFLPLDESWENEDGSKPMSRLQTVPDALSEEQFQDIHREEMRDMIAEALNELPEKEKLVVVLYYYENLTLKEIGTILNVSESRICQIHAKVMVRLKSYFKRIGEAVSLATV
jgi:RNA polymerase sigma factor for flagellar operon FliA